MMSGRKNPKTLWLSKRRERERIKRSRSGEEKKKAMKNEKNFSELLGLRRSDDVAAVESTRKSLRADLRQP